MAHEKNWLPQRVDEAHASINASVYLCDASSEYCALVGVVPKTGNLTRFEFQMAALANAVDNGIRCSFQDPSTSTGLPDGTPDQSATMASGAQAIGWVNPGDFDSPRAVTAGQRLCCVIENPTFTGSDSFAVGSYTFSTSSGLPYGVSGTGTKQQTSLPIIVLRYDDGSYATMGPEMWPVQQISNSSFQDDTNPDEVGMAFSVDRAYTLYGITAQISLSGGASTTIDFTLYDAAGSVIYSESIDNDVAYNTTGIRYHTFYLSTPLTLTAGATYRVAWHPTSTTSDFTMYWDAFNSQALMEAIAFGANWYLTTRNNGGSWTNYNNSSDGFRRPHISLQLEPPSGGSVATPRPFQTTLGAVVVRRAN